MSGENKKSDKKQRNIFSYAVIMIICVIIIILFAAMADNRENEIDDRINETQRTNETIQNELVRLKDENYNLNKKIQENETAASAYAVMTEQQNQLTEIKNLITAGKEDEAKTKIQAIDTSAFDENTLAYYSALCEILNIGQ